MQNHPHGDRLSWGDSVFLHLERDGMPLNVAGISIFEGQISFKSLLNFVESRLPLIPVYLKRVMPAPLNMSLPTWDYDQNFDIRNHVRQVSLKRGTEAELKTLAGKILSQVMDRQHPLWDMTLVHGLSGDRTALIARMHHCLADGLGGVGIMSVLMDSNPAATRAPRRRARLRVPSPQNASKSFFSGLTNSYFSFVDRLLSTWTNALKITEHTLIHGNELSDESFSNLLPEITAPTERLFFNAIYSGPQKFAWAEIPLSEVKEIRRVCDASVNDVLLALVTATIRRYAEKRGDKIKKRVLRVMVPVSMRGSGDAGDVGNHISLIPVTIPLDIRDPRKLVSAVHTRTQFLKRSRAAELVGVAGGLFGIIPEPIQVMAGPMISKLPITPFNMVCTNVPGPQAPLYLLGNKMVSWYPYVPVGGELALNCAILSYNGVVYFGFSGDAHITSDLARIEKLLQLSFAELRTACGIKAAAKPRKSPRKKEIIAPLSQSVDSAGHIAISDSLNESHSETSSTHRSDVSEPVTVESSARSQSAGGSM